MALTFSPNDRGLIARHTARLALPESGPVISLNEGSTPLIFAPRLGEVLGRGARVFVKYEGLNPTGSFKDRGMTMAITHAVANGAKAVICASTGNTSASAAAYAARAGLLCVVLLPAGKIARGKLAQACVYGSRIISIRGNFDDALNLVREIGARDDFEIVNSINPFRIEGQKTAAFEIVSELGDAPDLHVLPVGNAGNITAYWKGYREDAEAGNSSRLPVMLGMQAAGSAPIYYGHDIASPETIATAIRIGAPASRAGAETALRDSKGGVDIVTDEEILAAQAWLAANEGIFVEPASAASVAGLLKGVREPDSACGKVISAIPEGATIAVTVTGNGLKDAEIVMQGDDPVRETDATSAAVLRELGV